MRALRYGIESWSDKMFRAQKNYTCANCGDVIPKGMVYVRHVIRLGAQKGVDPLQNLHVHMDCQVPWYQPESTHRLKSVGNLPRRTPPPTVYDGTSYFHKPSIAINKAGVGSMQWQPDAGLAAKLVFTPNQSIAFGAMAEIESTLRIVLTAITQATGNKRKAMILNHQIEAIARLIDPIEAKTKAS